MKKAQWKTLGFCLKEESSNTPLSFLNPLDLDDLNFIKKINTEGEKLTYLKEKEEWQV